MKKILTPWFILPFISFVISGVFAYDYVNSVVEHPSVHLWIAYAVICVISTALSLVSAIMGLMGKKGTAATVTRVLTVMFFIPVAGTFLLVLMHTTGIIELLPPPQR